MTEQTTYAKLYAALHNKPLLLAAILDKKDGTVGLIPPEQYSHRLDEKVRVPSEVGRHLATSYRDSLHLLPIGMFIEHMILGVNRVEEKDGKMILPSAILVLYLVRRLAAIEAINYNR